MARRSKKKWTFWFSAQHAAHYRAMNSQYIGMDKFFRNVVMVEGKPVIYTTCSSRLRTDEPFQGAMATFPDYKMVAICNPGQITTEGIW